MAFFTTDEQKEFGSNFFTWQDNKTYKLTIGKRVEENFANGKKFVVLECTDLDTKEKFERKYEFALMNALQALGDEYVDETTKLEVTPKFLGKREYNGKQYDNWDFEVKLSVPF